MSKELKRNLVLVLISAIIGVVTYLTYPIAARYFGWRTISFIRPVEDTSTVSTVPATRDSVQLQAGKVSLADFENGYSAEAWYSKYRSNVISFNDTYQGKKIDVYAVIKDISKSFMGYSLIKLDTNNPTGDIICSNENDFRDKWKNEVKSVAVGDTVHIRGTWEDVGLDQDNMFLTHCHIIVGLAK
jgi:hypothetical protein